MRRFCLSIATVMGVLGLANGVYMLVDPDAWYYAVPGVTTTGPFNQHFIRDIGLIFLLLGGVFLIGVRRAEQRVLLWGGASLWLSGHALFHFWEVAAGICGPEVLARDFPAVTLPAIIGWVLTFWAARAQATQRPGRWFGGAASSVDL